MSEFQGQKRVKEKRIVKINVEDMQEHNDHYTVSNKTAKRKNINILQATMKANKFGLLYAKDNSPYPNKITRTKDGPIEPFE